MSVNKQIYITSASKAVNKARVSGKLDLSKVALFELYDYYIDFTDKLIDNNIFYYEDANITLKKEISKLKYKYPDEICNYKNIIGVDTIPTGDNTAPIVEDNTIDLSKNINHTFTYNDFTKGYYDAQGDQPSRVNIIIDSTTGTFTYNGSLITSNQFEFNISQVSNLVYTRPTYGTFNEVFYFKISDNNIDSKYSSIHQITLQGEIVENQPATIGDNTITVGNRITTVLTLSMFTSQLQPPYNDPEGDLIDAIRLDEISSANRGTFFVDGVQAVEGQIITRETINNGTFTHVGPDQDALWSDNFSFSARDEGSKIWVE